jgi:hypothetical protein
MKLLSVFDIETSALPPDQLGRVKPEFKPAKNLRDPEKIKLDVAEKEIAWRDNAALDATTGQVLCIGMWSGGATVNNIDITQAPEAETIERFWNWLELKLQRSELVVGFSIFHFDLPFLVRRSWALDVEVPKCVRRGRYWHEDLLDLQEVWKCGNYDQRVSLDTLAKTLGLGAKTGSGADFARLWAEDRKAALEYVSNDLTLTRRCAERMLGIKPDPNVTRFQKEVMPHLKPTETKLVDVPIP